MSQGINQPEISFTHESVLPEARPPCKAPKSTLVRIGESPAPDYWNTVEELHHGYRPMGEFPGGIPPASLLRSKDPEPTRRDFLSLLGFTTLVSLTACQAPVQNALPLVSGSDQIIPGVSNFYATTCRGCSASCSLLVKQRDGRPIKIEGNAKSALFGSGTCAKGQATVLSLYDDERLRGPLWQGKEATWEEIDRHVLEELNAAGASRKIVLLSGNINSPSTLEIISEWSKQHPNFRHIVYEPVSLSAIRTANQLSFDRAVIPHYAFDKARVIVGLEADFLGAWLSPVEFARQYVTTRKPEGTPSLHVQFESGFSVTGSNGDIRVPVAPSQLGLIAAALLKRIAQKTGAGDLSQVIDPIEANKLDAVADELWKHRKESLVVSGSQDVNVQVVVNAINAFLGNIGNTIDLGHASLQAGSDDAAMAELVEEMNRGDVHTLILYGVNPAYDYPDAEKFLRGLDRVALSISFTDRNDETGSHVHAICPDHHFLESWGDAEPVESYYSLSQPLIAPLFATRAAQESLLTWLGHEKPNYYEYVRQVWRSKMFPRQKQIRTFDDFWDQSLQAGVVDLPSSNPAVAANFHGDWTSAFRAITEQAKPADAAEHYELHIYQSVALGDGRYANNPWLQELPDPVSKVTWTNYAAVAPALAQKLGTNNGDIVAITTGQGRAELPVYVQPGQQEKTISVALGYGRTRVGRAGSHVGANVYPFTSIENGLRTYSANSISLQKTGRHEDLACTQTQFSLEGRPLVLETTFAELEKGAGEVRETESSPTLWAERLQGEHSWGMAIDMNSCTGCSACVIACQAENNVAVVGKDEVRRNRIMHWIRIDGYYRGAEDNPARVHQPMMCQHCQNAPCETVCPVLATTTSSEGLNQQVYNRCIGTRYCANNCPYKVRRFNWFQYTQNPEYDYTMESDLARMVLNPDVVVRSRGVMEKCSLCVQRIQLAKNTALQGKRELVDGDIQTACQQACPTQAIVFGDLRDPNSRVSQLAKNQRNYQVLTELGTRPNIGYLMKVRNSLGVV